jgi:hypothetical protein
MRELLCMALTFRGDKAGHRGLVADAAERARTPDSVFFVHVPKTAGSSFRTVLKRWFGSELMIFDSHDRAAFSRAWEDRDGPARAVAGHFGFGLHQAAPGCRPIYLSLVRDPVERFVSLYKHALQTPDHLLHGAAGAGLESFLSHCLSEPRARGQTTGIQCFFVSGQRSFEDARPVVDEAYSLIAPTDQFPEFVARAARLLGKPAPDAPARNVRPATPELIEAAARLADRIREAHQEDQRLYEHVSRRFAHEPS